MFVSYIDDFAHSSIKNVLKDILKLHFYIL